MKGTDLLAAAEDRGAERERIACARLVCELCAQGDQPLLDDTKGRQLALDAQRHAIRSAFAMESLHRGSGALMRDPDGTVRADANKRAHTKRCFLCRGGSEDTCAGLGAAAEVDHYRKHLRTCQAGCRQRNTGRPTLCAIGAKLRTVFRSSACLRVAENSARDKIADVEDRLAYPDEFFHVSADGGTERCAATPILLRGVRH